METKIVADEGVGMNLFKSYYVVWKLVFFAFSLFIKFLFKSYYVVWKLISASGVSYTTRGLNRTM